jgi:hypothetical protein
MALGNDYKVFTHLCNVNSVLISDSAFLDLLKVPRVCKIVFDTLGSG